METQLILEDSKLYDTNSKKVFLPKKCMVQIIKSIPKVKGEIKLKYLNNALYKDSQKIELAKDCLKNLERKVKLISEKEIKEKAKEAKKAIKAMPKGAPLPRTVVSTGASLTEITKQQEAIKAQQEKEKKEKEEIAEIESKVEIIKKAADSKELKSDLDEINRLLKDLNKLRTIDTIKRNKILSYLAEFARSPYIFLENEDKKKGLLVLLQETGLSNLTSLDQKLSSESFMPKTENDWITAYKSNLEIDQIYVTAASLKILKNLVQEKIETVNTMQERITNLEKTLNVLSSIKWFVRTSLMTLNPYLRNKGLPTFESDDATIEAYLAPFITNYSEPPSTYGIEKKWSTINDPEKRKYYLAEVIKGIVKNDIDELQEELNKLIIENDILVKQKEFLTKVLAFNE